MRTANPTPEMPKLRHSCLHFLWHNVITSAHWIEPSASTVATLWDFFFTHSFLPSRTLVPKKKIRVGKRFLYWPVTRYAQPTKSPKINITAREVDWAWWSQGAARWEVGQGGAGPLHHWWRYLLGWRAATMRRLACQHGSKWPTTGKWGLWQLLVAGAGGWLCFGLCQQSEELCCLRAPSPTDFHRQDHQTAPSRPHQFRVGAFFCLSCSVQSCPCEPAPSPPWFGCTCEGGD